jgi:hypothetical protein
MSRNTVTIADYTARGVDELSARQNSGIHTIALRGGRLHDDMRGDGPPAPCEGSYTARGGTFMFTWDPGAPCTGDFTATWTLRDGELRLRLVRVHDEVDRVLWGVRPFRRIG